MARRVVRSFQIQELANGGDGVGTLPEGKVVFVPRGLPDDLLDVRLIKEKKRWARGEIESIVKPSPHRIASRCDAFDRGCGGCGFWHAEYEKELGWKVKAAFTAMERIAGFSLPEPRVLSTGEVEGVRSRVTLHQRVNGEETRTGFFAAASHDVVPVEKCLVADAAINEALEELGGVLAYLGNCDILVETAGDGQVVLQVTKDKGSLNHGTLKVVDEYVERALSVAGLELRIGERKPILFGNTTISVEQAQAAPPVEAFQIAAGRFRQAHRELNRKLVAEVVSRVEAEAQGSALKVLDCFCGSGNFSFPLAAVCDEVLGLEGEPAAVGDAQQMAELAGLTNVNFRIQNLFEEGALDDVLTSEVGVLVLDPPRTGAAEIAARLSAGSESPLVIYVSCDPACLARDMKTLAAGGWAVEELLFFDMFPRTPHVEALAVLRR